MVSLRDAYGFGKGDFAGTKTGERLTIRKIDYRGSEGTLVDVTVHANGRILKPHQIGRYEKA